MILGDVFTSSLKLEIRHFHVVVASEVTTKKSTKQRDARPKWFFTFGNLKPAIAFLLKLPCTSQGRGTVYARLVLQRFALGYYLFVLVQHGTATTDS